MLTRFVSDQLFLEQKAEVLPNLFGSMLLVSGLSLAIGVIGLVFFEGISLLAHGLMLASFICLSNLWLLIIFMSGMKQFKKIVAIMAQGYFLLIVLAWFLRHYGSEGLFLAFFLSQAYLLFAFLHLIVAEFIDTQKILSFDFLKPQYAFYSLFACGTFYNLGVWSDKFVFWLSPSTSSLVVGWFRTSVIYDIPIFLAYLSVIPGMAVFLVRIETDFAELHERYYNEVRGTATLQTLITIKGEMNTVVRAGMAQIIKVQAVIIALLALWGEQLLATLGIDTAYHALFTVDLVGVGIQVLFLSILNVLFYFDKRYMAVTLTGIFCVSNAVLSLLTVWLGPEYYGFGFLGAVSLSTLVGFWMLDNVFQNLEYDTFMLQK